MNLTKSNLKQVLRAVGGDRIQRKDLCRVFNAQDRAIRNMIRELRLEGCPIIGDCGYGWARNKKEYKRTLAQYRKRAISCLRVISADKKFNWKKFKLELLEG